MNPIRACATGGTAGIAYLFATLHSGGAQTDAMFLGLALLLTCLGMAIAWSVSLMPASPAQPPQDATQTLTLPVTATTAVLALLAGWLIVTVRVSLLPGTSSTVGWIVSSLPIGCLVAVLALNLETAWAAFLRVIKTIALVVMLLGVIDFLVLRTRPFSVFEDINVLAAFCNAFALPAMAQLHRRSKAEGAKAAVTSGSAGFLLVALACLAATASRGGHLSFMLGMLVYGAVLIRHDRSAWKSIAAGLLAFVTMLALIAPLQNADGSLSRLTSIQGDQSTGDRIEMLKSTWRMVEDGPWYGSGLGTYKIRYLAYRSPNERSTTGDLAHNDYLQLLAEGGPVLSGLLLMLAVGVGHAALRLWRTARLTSDSPRFIESAGLVGALFCLFGHAALNFIFYVMPLAMITGLYLGRLDSLRTDVRTFDLHRYVSRPMLLTLIGGVTLWLTATLGLQSAFYVMTTGKCDLRMCRSLSGDEKFFGKFSALLAATQPSYLPAREWFVNAYTATANTATDDAKRIESARLAAKELSDQIREFPALPYTYLDLASLIIKHPEAAAAIDSSVSNDPTTLLKESVRRNPLDTSARTLLAQRLEADGQLDAAFSLLFDDGMRWWKVAALPDSGRVALLKGAIPLAIKIGRCTDATEMANGLAVFLPDDPLSKPSSECIAAPNPA